MSKAWKDKLQNTGVVSVYDDKYTRAWLYCPVLPEKHVGMTHAPTILFRYAYS